MFIIKPEVLEAWKEIGRLFQKSARQIGQLFQNFKMKQPGLPGATAEKNPNIYKPLRLNLQFFADDDPPASSKAPDGFYATLKDAFKANPHLQTEHKTAITDAVSERFKKYNFDADEARDAIAEKRQREADKAAGKDEESEAVKNLKATNAKLEAKTKKLALESVTGDAEQAKLISRLASDKVSELKLNDEFELDKAAVDSIVGELREEFPNLFPVADDSTGGNDDQNNQQNNQQQTPPPGGTRTGGTNQRTNTPPGTNQDAAAIMAETFANLKKTNRI